MRLLITVLAAYILAAPLTSKISMNLQLTEWYSLWTYIMWALAIPIWIVILGGVSVVVSK